MRTFFLCLFCFAAAFFSCQQNQTTSGASGKLGSDAAVSDTSSRYTLGFYNVENLFDTLDTPGQYDEDFTPGGRLKWGTERYRDKQQKIAEVIRRMTENTPDQDGPEILGLAEVENRAVLEDLVKQKKLQPYDYRIVHHESPDERGIDVALLYKASVVSGEVAQKTFALSFPSDPSDRTRDILLADLPTKKGSLFVLVNHWPSRGGGPPSKTKRQHVAQRLKAIIDSLSQAQPEKPLIVLGDLNDTPGNESVKEDLGAQWQKPAPGETGLYNTMASYHQKGVGSHYWRDERNVLDHVIVNEDLLDDQHPDYIRGSATIFGPDWLRQKEPPKYRGFPDRTYAGSNYLGGYSDHFPVFIQIR